MGFPCRSPSRGRELARGKILKLLYSLLQINRNLETRANPLNFFPQAAKRVLEQAAGVNMNTWVVGRVPVAHLVEHPVRKADGVVDKKGKKTFFLKGRIMAGQADLKGNPLGYTDFKWLTREELEKELSPEYYKGVRNMMSDR